MRNVNSKCKRTKKVYQEGRSIELKKKSNAIQGRRCSLSFDRGKKDEYRSSNPLTRLLY